MCCRCLDLYLHCIVYRYSSFCVNSLSIAVRLYNVAVHASSQIGLLHAHAYYSHHLIYIHAFLGSFFCWYRLAILFCLRHLLLGCAVGLRLRCFFLLWRFLLGCVRSRCRSLRWWRRPFVEDRCREERNFFTPLESFCTGEARLLRLWSLSLAGSLVVQPFLDICNLLDHALLVGLGTGVSSLRKKSATPKLTSLKWAYLSSLPVALL